MTATQTLTQHNAYGAASVAELNVLEPAKVRIYRPDSGFPNLIIREKACYPRIRIVRCFPLSGGTVYISLRDWGSNEIGLIENIALLSPESREIVHQELDKRYFVSQVTDIHSIKHRYGFTVFDVETNRGRRTFNVQDRRRNIVHLGRGRVFIIDTDGCQYDIPNHQLLSHHARAQLDRIL